MELWVVVVVETTILTFNKLTTAMYDDTCTVDHKEHEAIKHNTEIIARVVSCYTQALGLANTIKPK